MPEDPEQIVVQLGIDHYYAPVTFGNLISTLAVAIANENAEFAFSALERRDIPAMLERVESRHFAFAEYLISARIIPFEQSPLSAESLGNIAASTSVTGVGAVVGYLIAGPTPLLLITVPAGIIICGAAAGVARGLEDGLRRRITRFIKGRD